MNVSLPLILTQDWDGVGDVESFGPSIIPDSIPYGLCGCSYLPDHFNLTQCSSLYRVLHLAFADTNHFPNNHSFALQTCGSAARAGLDHPLNLEGLASTIRDFTHSWPDSRFSSDPSSPSRVAGLARSNLGAPTAPQGQTQVTL